MTKQEARYLAGTIRNRLSDFYREKASQVILEKVQQMEEYQNAEVIFCYVSTEDEVNTWPVIGHALEHGKKVGVPVCIGDGIMEVREITSFSQLKKGAYGIIEPDSSCRKLEKEEIQLALIPCVSADQTGRRLGHGAGYYDRYLADTRFVKAALCWGELMMDRIPVDELDIRMDRVISEKEDCE